MRLALPIVLLSGAAAGLLAGRYLFPHLPHEDAGAGQTGLINRPAGPLPPAANDKPAPRPAAQDISVVLSDPIAANRRQALYQTLAGLTKDNWQPVYAAFMQRRKEGRHDGTEWELFLNALGAVDGARAMERLMADFSPDMNGVPWPDYHYLVRTWVPANKEEAMAWQSSLPKGLFRDGLWSGVIGGLAEVDLQAAIGEVEKMDPDTRRYFLYDLSPRVFQQGGLAGGEAWLQTVATAAANKPESRSHVARVFSMVSSRVVETHTANGRPLDAVDWLAKHRQQPYWSGEHNWQAAVRDSLKADPQKALAHFAAMDGQMRGETLHTGVMEWAKTDATAAERWLAAKQDEPWYDSAAKGLINHHLQSKPADAQKWIESLADPAARDAYKSRLPR
jgi:hypothetical protein